MKTITLGRSSSCDIVIPDDRISRVHAEVSVVDGRYVFRDLSKNGSSLNGQVLSSSKIVVTPGANILLSHVVPLPWAQIYALLPVSGVRVNPNNDETRYASIKQQPQPNNNYSSYVDDHLGIGWGILAFLIPIAGWIMYFCWKDETPKRASTAATIAWISFAINIISIITAL